MTAAQQQTKSRPILFSAPMVRAILAERKTQTRRIAKPQPFRSDLYSAECAVATPHWCLDASRAKRRWAWPCGSAPDVPAALCPYGQPGDTLWVKETWWHYKSPELEMAAYDNGNIRTFLDDGRTHEEPQKEIAGKLWHPGDCDIWAKRPSILMPLRASRITLRIADVRAEWLNDISEADAMAEGVERHPTTGGYVDAFAALWNEINGEDSWAKNDLVWAITFEQVKS